MTATYSKNLSQRLSRYIGVNERSPWGRRAAELGITALKGHGPWAVKCLDFGEIHVPNATAFAATPLNITISDVNAPTTATTIANGANGYVLLNPGTKADSGTSYQWNVANVPGSLMQLYASPNDTISPTRDFFWGIRCAFSCGTSAWGTADSGKAFMGIASTDVNVMPNTTGIITQSTMDQGIGFEISELGIISLICTESVGNAITRTSLTTPTMATSLNGVALSILNNNWTSASFHDWAFYAHWGSGDATSASSFVEFYFDGNLVGTISGAGKLPAISGAGSTDLFNIIELINGTITVSVVDMAVTEIINATPRLHIPQ